MKKSILFAGVTLLIFLASFKRDVKKPLFPDKWYNLERDITGYVFYQPCDGDAPSITIHNNKLTIRWQLESETVRIISFRQEKGIYKIKCRNANERIDLVMRWLDKQHSMALWKFTNNYGSGYIYRNKWVMCPAAKKNDFKVVSCVPNDSVKTPEMQFLPINIK